MDLPFTKILLCCYPPGSVIPPVLFSTFPINMQHSLGALWHSLSSPPDSVWWGSCLVFVVLYIRQLGRPWWDKLGRIQLLQHHTNFFFDDWQFYFAVRHWGGPFLWDSVSLIRNRRKLVFTEQISLGEQMVQWIEICKWVSEYSQLYSINGCCYD